MHDDLTLPLDDSQPSASVPAIRDAWGPFRLLARVGSGGFGEVYRAWDPNLEREVALKLLLPGAVGGDEEYKAMLREARAMASVQHPNIVHVYGIDRHDGRVGFWTDFVKGKTLSALLGAQGPFGYREAALIGIDVSRALSAVHRSGLLHRDIKAENVMREEGGRILLMDFGLSAGERSLGGQIAGTPNYMAPELFDGGKATPCTDIYAMGVLLYYLVIGEYPARLSGLTVNEAKAALARRTPLIDLRSDLPEQFLRTVRIAIELDPAKRFNTAGELAESLAASLETGFSPGSGYTPAPQPSNWTPSSTPGHTSGQPPAQTAPWSSPTPSAYPPTTPGSWTSSPVPPPPPPTPRLPSEPAKLSNLFGGVGLYNKLSKRGRWVLFGLIIFFTQKGWRSAISNHPPERTHRAAPAPPAPPSSTNDEYLKAEDLLDRPYKDSNVVQAIKGFQQILGEDPKFALAHAGLGSAYFTQYRSTHDAKLLDKAKASTNAALAIDPNLAAAYVTLARMEAAQGNTALALQQAQKAVTLDPRNADAHGALAQVYDAQGRSGDAIAAVQQAIDMAPDRAVWPLRLGVYLFAAGKLDQARERWKESVDLDSDNPLALYDLGLVDIDLDQLADARESLDKAVKIQPSPAAYSALGTVLMLQGKFDDAVAMNHKAIDLDPNAYEQWGNLASSYLWSKDGRDKAKAAYEKAISLGEAQLLKTPNDPSLLVQLADYYASTHRPERSLVLVRKATALSADDPNITYRAGETYEILGDREKATRLIVQAIAKGYHEVELRSSPELASLRSDPGFQAALATAKARKL